MKTFISQNINKIKLAPFPESILFAQDIATLNDATVYSVGATFIVTKK